MTFTQWVFEQSPLLGVLMVAAIAGACWLFLNWLGVDEDNKVWDRPHGSQSPDGSEGN